MVWSRTRTILQIKPWIGVEEISQAELPAQTKVLQRDSCRKNEATAFMEESEQSLWISVQVWRFEQNMVQNTATSFIKEEKWRSCRCYNRENIKAGRFSVLLGLNSQAFFWPVKVVYSNYSAEFLWVFSSVWLEKKLKIWNQNPSAKEFLKKW